MRGSKDKSGAGAIAIRERQMTTNVFFRNVAELLQRQRTRWPSPLQALRDSQAAADAQGRQALLRVAAAHTDIKDHDYLLDEPVIVWSDEFANPAFRRKFESLNPRRSKHTDHLAHLDPARQGSYPYRCIPAFIRRSITSTIV
jgi:hypothetical protein